MTPCPLDRLLRQRLKPLVDIQHRCPRVCSGRQPEVAFHENPGTNLWARVWPPSVAPARRVAEIHNYLGPAPAGLIHVMNSSQHGCAIPITAWSGTIGELRNLLPGLPCSRICVPTKHHVSPCDSVMTSRSMRPITDRCLQNGTLYLIVILTITASPPT